MAVPEELEVVKPSKRELSIRNDEDDRVREKTERFFRLRLPVTFTSSHSSSDLELKHEAGVIPTDAIVAIPTADCRIYKGNTEWTRDYIYLRSSAACDTAVYLVI